MFINTLPFIFGYSQFTGPLELLIVFGCLLGVLYISSPFPENSRQGWGCLGLGFYQYICRAWYGELLLSFIFWPFFLILNGAWYGTDTMAKAGMISVSSWDNVQIMLAGPVIWWTVAVWRGSERTGSRWWSACARLAVLSAYFEYGLRLYISQEYPRIFFMCEELLLDYFSCF